MLSHLSQEEEDFVVLVTPHICTLHLLTVFTAIILFGPLGGLSGAGCVEGGERRYWCFSLNEKVGLCANS